MEVRYSILIRIPTVGCILDRCWSLDWTYSSLIVSIP